MVLGDLRPVAKYRFLGPLSNSRRLRRHSSAKRARPWCNPKLNAASSGSLISAERTIAAGLHPLPLSASERLETPWQNCRDFIHPWVEAHLNETAYLLAAPLRQRRPVGPCAQIFQQ
jgi:hypothetical protein